MSSVFDRLTTALSRSYLLDRELGAGGMATVYLAHDLKHQRDVAIKVLQADLAAALGGDHVPLVDRTRDQLRAAARLRAPDARQLAEWA